MYADPSPFLDIIRESLVGGKPPQARRTGAGGINPADDADDGDTRRAALGSDSLAEHLRRTTGAKAATGGSPASKYAAGETGGYAKANAWKRRMNSARRRAAAGEGGRGARRGRRWARTTRRLRLEEPRRRAAKGERNADEEGLAAGDGGRGRRGQAASRAQEEPRQYRMSGGGRVSSRELAIEKIFAGAGCVPSVDHADIPASSQNGPAG